MTDACQRSHHPLGHKPEAGETMPPLEWPSLGYPVHLRMRVRPAGRFARKPRTMCPMRRHIASDALVPRETIRDHSLQRSEPLEHFDFLHSLKDSRYEVELSFQ